MNRQRIVIREMARVCEHPDCANIQTGVQIGRDQNFDRLDELEHIANCPILSARDSGMSFDCPHWVRARVRYAPEE